MALNPAHIAVVSQPLDQALALPEAEREAWLAAQPAEHQVRGAVTPLAPGMSGLRTRVRLSDWVSLSAVRFKDA